MKIPTPAAVLRLLASCSIAFASLANGASSHPLPDSDQWLKFEGGEGPGAGKHVVLLAAEQEYRAEQALPMLARMLAKHHGFHCTVLFLMNEEGLVDPTLPSPFKEEGRKSIVPGLEHLEKADAFIWMSRFLQLEDSDLGHLYSYFDSGRPIIALRTANHGLWRDAKPYQKDGEDVSLDRLLGGKFRGHHGGWKREATSGVIVPEARKHPILRGVQDVWGTTDVYRCHVDGKVPDDCTPILLGQPMQSLDREALPNLEKEALPIAWTKSWVGNKGLSSPVFHFTMGSAKDFENEGVRRITVNALYWGLGLAEQIQPDSDVSIVGDYTPLQDGFKYEEFGVRPRPVDFYR
ncbi:ThuA domain-containing protein [Roseibacillus persicicus]|uniref:ThuA domain-containing protein n=1 Tax=Roseibacillus persicicus TaxID=454148 RepID=UPI00398A61C8